MSNTPATLTPEEKAAADAKLLEKELEDFKSSCVSFQQKLYALAKEFHLDALVEEFHSDALDEEFHSDASSDVSDDELAEELDALVELFDQSNKPSLEELDA